LRVAGPVEQKRATQADRDAINATRAAIEEGIAGGGLSRCSDSAAADGMRDGLKGRCQNRGGTAQRALRRTVFFYVFAPSGLKGVKQR